MAAGALTIGVYPDAKNSRYWPKIVDFLQPAVDQGDRPMLLEHELVWTVHDGPELLAAATTRITRDGFAEVMFVGGRDYRRWLRPLDDMIAAWASDEGMSAVRAYGRRGWVRVLGWDVLSVDGGSTIYERRLR